MLFFWRERENGKSSWVEPRFDWDELLLVVCQGGAIRWDRGGRERGRRRIRGAFQTSLDIIRALGMDQSLIRDAITILVRRMWDVRPGIGDQQLATNILHTPNKTTNRQTDKSWLTSSGKNKSFNTTTLIVVEPQFKSYFKCKIKGLDLGWYCSFQCCEFSRGKCFVWHGIVLKRECKTRIFFVLLQQGVFEGECLVGRRGVVNMWGIYRR